MYRLLLLLAVPALASAYYTMTVYGDVNKDKEFFQWTFPTLIDDLFGHINVTYHLLGSGRHSVPQMCALDQLKGNVFLQVDYLRCESDGLPAATCLCRNGIDAEIHKECVLHEKHRAVEAATAHHRLSIHKSPIIFTSVTGPLYNLFEIRLLKAVCSIYSEEDKPPGCLTLTGNGNGTMSSFDRNNPVHFECK